MKAFILKYICLVLALFVLTFLGSAFSVSAQVFHETDFEGSSNGWSHYPSTQTVNWQFSSGLTDNGPSSAQSGSTFFYVDNIEKKPVGEVSIVQTFDFSGYTMPVLSFYYYCNAKDGLNAPRLTVSTFDPKHNDFRAGEGLGAGIFSADTKGQWVKLNVCLSRWSGKIEGYDNSNVLVKISSTIENSPCANIAIDNLKIENFYISDAAENFKDAKCHGGTGEIKIVPVGGGPVYRYSLDGNDFGDEEEAPYKVFENVKPKDYLSKVEDVASGCVAEPPSGFVSITQPAEIKTKIDIVTDVSCYDNPDGVINITASESTGNNTPYYYSVSTEKLQEPNTGSCRIGDLKGGTYYVRVKNKNGCISADDSVKLGEDCKLIIKSVSVTDMLDKCYGDQKGQILITAEANTKVYGTTQHSSDITYSIRGNVNTEYSNINENNFTKLAAGTYNVWVRDANGCSIPWENNPVVLKQPEKLEFEASEPTDVTGCNGDATGKITVNAKGGTAPLKYYLNSQINYSADGNFENLAAGVYYPIVVDENNCRIDATDAEEYSDVKVTLSEPTVVEITGVSQKNILTCFGDNTGEITVTAKGGTGSLFYCVYQQPPKSDDPENPAPPVEFVYSENNVFENMTAGTYYVTVKDEENCQYRLYEGQQTKDEIEVVLYEPDKFSFIQATETSAANLCFGDEKGQVFVSVDGGTFPYTFTVTGTKADGGDFSREATFDDRVGNMISKLPAGEYTVSAKDKMDCAAEDTYPITITQPEEIVIETVEITDVDCYLNATGQAVLSAKGGTGSYSYGRRTATTDENAGFAYFALPVLTDLRAGKYDFAVKDANKCVSYKLDQEVKEPARLEFRRLESYDVETCYGDAAGEIILEATGGVSPYWYSIDDGETLHECTDMYISFKELPAGEYPAFVQDANGCEARPNYVLGISEPNKLVITNLYYHEVAGCHGTANGTIRFEADGGSDGWKFSLERMGNYTEGLAANFQNLPAGIYYPSVEDGHGCHDYAAPIEITEPEPMVLVSEDVTGARCYGLTGEAVITVEGGKIYQTEFPYHFYLNGKNDPDSYDGRFVYMDAGVYNYEVKDMYGCTLTGSFTISQPDSFGIVDIDYKDILGCYGDLTGEISFSLKGGTGPFVYSVEGLNHYEENSTGVFNQLPATQFVLGAKDINGCTAEDVVTLEQPEKLVYSAELTRKIACHNDGDAEITVEASGGTGDLMYSVDGGISYNYTENVISGLKAGNYKIKVRDANNCTQKYTDDITVVNPALLEADYESYDVVCHEGNTGKIVATASGGTKPYFYSLDSVNWQQVTGLFNNLSDGVYVVKIHDQNDCVTEAGPITIKRPASIAGFTADQTYGCSPLKVLFTQDNQGLVANYEISNGDKIFDRSMPTEYTFVNSGSEPEKFKITASVMHPSGVGCNDTSSMMITVYPIPKIDFRMGVDSIIWPENTANFANMTKNAQSVHWDFGDGTTSDDPMVSTHEYPSCGNYNIVLKIDDGRCENTLIKPFVIAPKPLSAAFSSSKLFGCQPWEISAKNESVNSDSCKWDFGDGSDPVYNLTEVSHSYPDAGSYMLSLTVYGDCGSQAVSSKKISVFTKPEAGFEQNLDTLYSGQYLKLEADAVSADSYKWNFGDGNFGEGRTVDHKYEFEGTFNVSLTVITANSCSDTATTHKAVTVINSPIVLYPNAFSPNGDGKNDVFRPVHGDVSRFKLVILNRKGVIVFQTENIDEGWDGTRNGKPCPPGMYVWKAVSMLKDKQTVHQKGNIYLFR